jgi:hypothetical protein
MKLSLSYADHFIYESMAQPDGRFELFEHDDVTTVKLVVSSTDFLPLKSFLPGIRESNSLDRIKDTAFSERRLVLWHLTVLSLLASRE